MASVCRSKEAKKSLENKGSCYQLEQNSPISGSHVQAFVLQEPPRDGSAVSAKFVDCVTAAGAPISTRNPACLFDFPVGTVFPQN